MRYRTYEAVLDELCNCEARRDAAFVETAAQLFGAMGLATQLQGIRNLG